METETYHFTREQLSNLLFGTIGMYREYMDVHEHSEDSSRFDAVNEVFEGLDAERELHAAGEGRLSMQLPDDRAEQAEAALAAVQTMPVMSIEPEQLARKFHQVYEGFAPYFGYETRQDTREFDPSSQNGRLMTSVCFYILGLLRGEQRADVQP